MAAQAAALGRSHYPPITSYQTPQSNSPASMNSPQPDSHARSMYSMPSMQSMPAMQQQPPPPPPPQQQQQQQQSSMYYGSQYMQHSVYGPPHASPHPQSHQHQPHPPPQQQPRHHPHQQLSPAPAMLMSQPVQPAHHQLHLPHTTHHSQHQPQHSPPTSAYDAKPPIHSQQQTPNTAQSHTPASSTSNTNLSASSAAPGPIPATTPLLVRQDKNGTQWIAFEYSRDRVKMEYTIRCDVESVNVDELSAEFKNANCVYPRACCSKEQYKGNRLHYESDCNSLGWALAQLNPPIREKRGLIQRAVDSWRNSNQDQRLRSRRVRRIAKLNNRRQNSANAGVANAPPHPGSASGSSTHGGTPTSSMGVPNDYNSTPTHHHHAPHAGLPSSQHTPRYAQSFYPTHPAPMTTHHSLDSSGMRHASTLAAPATADDEDDEERQQALFGNIPESRKRKFILVDDLQRGTRVRVRVTLDKVKLDDMPDAHLRLNAVYPRSYFPRQTTEDRVQWDDEDDSNRPNAGRSGGRGSSGPSARSGAPNSFLDDEIPLAIGSTFVPCPMMDGDDSQLSLPRMTTSRRRREVSINELGCRMAWGQARQFSGRPLFLQRALDAYRSKTRGSLVAAGNDLAEIAPHFETRSGKRKLSAARIRYVRRE